MGTVWQAASAKVKDSALTNVLSLMAVIRLLFDAGPTA